MSDENTLNRFIQARDAIDRELNVIGIILTKMEIDHNRALSSYKAAQEAFDDMRRFCIALPVGRDGQHIWPRDVVYGRDGREWHVSGIGAGQHCVKVWAVEGGRRINRGLRPEWLTHERPDSWERIAEDAGGEIAERIRALAGREDAR